MHPIDIPMQAANLWLRGAELGVRAALLPVHLSARAASAVLDRVPTGQRPTPPPPVSRPPRRPTSAKPKPKPGPKAKAKAPSRREIHPEPAAGHAEVRVAEPWEGYAALSAAEVIDRLADADETLLAAVRLYEGAHEAREAVMHATES